MTTKTHKEIKNKLKIIIEKQAISWAIGIVSCEEIDKMIFQLQFSNA